MIRPFALLQTMRSPTPIGHWRKTRRVVAAAAIADLKIALKLARDAGDTPHEDYVAAWLEDLGKSLNQQNPIKC